ncbi:MAG: hypothetical protein AB9891_06600 [Anaerolineaceae bacterium]
MKPRKLLIINVILFLSLACSFFSASQPTNSSVDLAATQNALQVTQSADLTATQNALQSTRIAFGNQQSNTPESVPPETDGGESVSEPNQFIPGKHFWSS